MNKIYLVIIEHSVGCEADSIATLILKSFINKDFAQSYIDKLIYEVNPIYIGDTKIKWKDLYQPELSIEEVELITN